MGACALDAAPAEVAYLWPDCADTWRHWCALQTQWRVGAAGRTGLDYTAVCAYLALHEPDPQAQRDHLAGLQAAEWASLEVWAEQRERQDARA